MSKFTFEEFEKAMEKVHIRIDGGDTSLKGPPICIAVALVSALESLLDDSDEREKFMIRGLITQVFAEVVVDDKK